MFLAKYGQKTCRSDLRIATCRESEFPPTKNCAVNAKNLHTQPLMKGFTDFLQLSNNLTLLQV